MNREPIPGTFAPGFLEPSFVSVAVPKERKPAGVKGWVAWRMGECLVHRFRDFEGLQLVVSHASRYPTWDEIKTARYRLLPLGVAYALILPPPDEYVDDPRNRYVFQLVSVKRDYL